MFDKLNMDVEDVLELLDVVDDVGVVQLLVYDMLVGDVLGNSIWLGATFECLFAEMDVVT